MTWEKFFPYQRMMIYALLLALRGFHKGKKKDIEWVLGGGMEHWIAVAGLDLDPLEVMDLTPKQVEKGIRYLRKYGE